MLNLKTDNPLLLAAREKVKNYLLQEVLKESPLNAELIDDLINMSEAWFEKMEINEKNIALVYTKIYAPELISALPEHMLKETNNLKIVK